MLYISSKVFSKTNHLVFDKLFKTFVRMILEFVNSAWTPVLQKDILLLETVQRKAKRIPFGKRRSSYQEQLALMNLCSLSDRRKRGDVAYQALSSDQSPVRHLFPLDPNRRTRGHSLKLLKDYFRTQVRLFFITNRVFVGWNALPREIVQAPFTNPFKPRYDAFQKT
ncbi:hypothetical protein Zmor_026759 [Zophobas morio]|uniref:Uncharacterized protein n=1 Tax=Zophobas morio TaxID=2755281 RepID=A0AA38HVA5_9CUCU|nr:hypothetical protein Zmor_026759 [Zophobas morio]